jgi:4'-phosphopantetheinyl transferase
LILSSYIEEEPSGINLSTHPAGKPFLPDQAINFNISHSGNMLILGFGYFDHIGVDVQEEYSISNLEIVLERFFSPEEQDYLYSLDPDLRQTQFFSIWSAKEAYLKALGEGFRLSSTAFSALPEDGSSQTYLLTSFNNPEPHQNWMIREINLQPGFKGAAAVSGNLSEIVMLPFHLDTP